LKYRAISALAILVNGITLSASAHDEEVVSRLESVVVYGRGLELIGDAGAASEGVVGYGDFEDRPLSRVGELVEVIPGAVATQHSGEGKANQFFLRGFNLDHGTDFSAMVDGVPINLRTHGHGQGYLDLNFIIPEIVERVDYRKGPYSAQTGDFSSAGSAQYTTADRFEENFAEISFGEGNFLRGVGAASFNLSDATTLSVAAEAQTYDGPWVLEQDLKKINGLAKLTHVREDSSYQLIATAYDSEWTSTDQVPLRAIQSGAIDRFGFIDDDLGGQTKRYSLAGNAHFDHDDTSRTDIEAYAVSYEFNLFSNFTYFLDDPVNGDEFEQLDERIYYGGAVRHERSVSDKLKLRVGSDARFDNISDIGLFRTAARQRLSTTRRDEVEELSLSAWGEAEYALTENLRVIGGARGDYFDAEVTGISLPVNGGVAEDTLVSPSAAIAWKATPRLELFANYGQGFHSNDVRGATIRFDPVTGDPAEQVPLLVRSEGSELGARFETGLIKATIALFQLELDSELVFVGDAGATETNDASKRTGVEISAFWTPADWLVFDLGGAYTDAEFDIPGNETRIPGAVESVVSGGVLTRFDDLTLSGRVRHFGKAPLIEDGSVSSGGTTLVNLSANYDWRNMTFGLDIYNAFDSADADISYFYESRLQGEANAVEDVHFHPAEPRQVRATVRVRF